MSIYVYIQIYAYTNPLYYKCAQVTFCNHRVMKIHRMPYLHRSFPQKSPISSGSFAKNDLQLKATYASFSPCTVILKLDIGLFI